MTKNKISVIMPYWRRGAALLEGLFSYALHEVRDDLELVVVDDGSPDDTARAALKESVVNLDGTLNPTLHPFGTFDSVSNAVRVRLVELPIKQEPMCPCTPINAGVRAADGEFIVLTNPETTLRGPLLSVMRAEILARGPSTYVLAAAWCPEAGAWHCHSQYASAGYHFFTMMHRSLWDESGGFDEEYRAGNCFDDPDFVQRMLRAGARFVFRDDLVVDHRKSGATIYWPREGWDRNHEMYWRKWPNPRTLDGAPMTNERLQNWR